jgi:probable selenium-dependent hydroxylase accessory protein YqeC
MKLSDALETEKNSVITFVGAGGKSSLLRRLGTEWREQGRPFLLTTTTKMFYRQVLEFAPVICSDYKKGLIHVENNITRWGYAGWFREVYDKKVLGLPVEWIDKLISVELVSNILIEGDGARQKLVKAPAADEPLVPSLNKTVIGVLSLAALDKELTSSVVHRLDIVAPLLGKRIGEKIKTHDIALLASGDRGIFSNASGEKMLVLTNGESCSIKTIMEIIDIIKATGKNDIRKFVVTSGFDKQMEPILHFV